jgi:hypothetical protein
MPDFGIMRGFNDKLFGDKLVAGQLPVNLGKIGSENVLPILLDLFPNAQVAFSLRKLREAYTGSAIRVRRSSDNTELNIGFDALGELDTAALLAFTGTGASDNGFINSWYDQSGNAKNATQIVSSSQPIIVNGGSLLLQSGKPIMKGLNDSAFLNISAITRASVTSIFYAMSFDTTDNFFATISDGGGSYFLLGEDGSASPNQFNVGIPINYRNGNLFTALTRNPTYDDFQVKSLLTIINGSTNSINPFNLGYRAGGPIKMSNSQELIIYNFDQSSNRTAIEDNINDFYSIY